MENPVEKTEVAVTEGGNKGKRPTPKWGKWLIILALTVGVGALFWLLIPDAEKGKMPVVSLEEPFEAGYVEEEATFVEEEVIAQQECLNTNMMNPDKEGIETVCEDAEVIECPEGMELNDGETECVEYIDTKTDEPVVETLRKLTKAQETTMHQMISYLMNLYGNDKYLVDEETYKAVMGQVLAPSYYKDDVFNATYKELKQYNERTTDLRFLYVDVEVVSVREGNNFDVVVSGKWLFKENGKQKTEKRELLLQVQTLPNKTPLISYYRFSQ